MISVRLPTQSRAERAAEEWCALPSPPIVAALQAVPGECSPLQKVEQGVKGQLNVSATNMLFSVAALWRMFRGKGCFHKSRDEFLEERIIQFSFSWQFLTGLLTSSVLPLVSFPSSLKQPPLGCVWFQSGSEIPHSSPITDTFLALPEECGLPEQQVCPKFHTCSSHSCAFLGVGFSFCWGWD